MIVNPGQALVLYSLGQYVGTIKKNGMYFFCNCGDQYNQRTISLQYHNLDGRVQLEVDKNGNPVEIAIVVLY